MTNFGIIMTMKTSPMPPEKQAEAMKAIRDGFAIAGREMGCEVECRVYPMPENYTIIDLRDLLIANS